jgi:hypothetical protein
LGIGRSRGAVDADRPLVVRFGIAGHTDKVDQPPGAIIRA